MTKEGRIQIYNAIKVTPVRLRFFKVPLPQADQIFDKSTQL